jgi:hypothetical protein
MPKKIKIHTEARAVVIARTPMPGDNEIRYVYDPEKLITPEGGFSSVRLGKGEDYVALSSWDDAEAWGDATDKIFLFYVEDCFDPALHAIVAPSWETAYERFCELEADRGFYLIRDDDPDYDDESVHWTDDGRRVDSEAFQCLTTEPMCVVKVVR